MKEKKKQTKKDRQKSKIINTKETNTNRELKNKNKVTHVKETTKTEMTENERRDTPVTL